MTPEEFEKLKNGDSVLIEYNPDTVYGWDDGGIMERDYDGKIIKLGGNIDIKENMLNLYNKERGFYWQIHHDCLVSLAPEKNTKEYNIHCLKQADK